MRHRNPPGRIITLGKPCLPVPTAILVHHLRPRKRDGCRRSNAQAVPCHLLPASMRSGAGRKPLCSCPLYHSGKLRVARHSVIVSGLIPARKAPASSSVSPFCDSFSDPGDNFRRAFGRPPFAQTPRLLILRSRLINHALVTFALKRRLQSLRSVTDLSAKADSFLAPLRAATPF